MSKLQPWLNFAKISQDAEGNWVLNVLGRELFVRAYGGTMKDDTDECIIVIGNRRTLDDFDKGTIEAEFVFPQGEKLLTANVLKSDPTEPIDVDFKDEPRAFLYSGEWEDSNDYPDHEDDVADLGSGVDYLTDDEVDDLINAAAETQKDTAHPPQWYSDLKAHYSGNDPDGKAYMRSLLERSVDQYNNRAPEEREDRLSRLDEVEDS